MWLTAIVCLHVVAMNQLEGLALHDALWLTLTTATTVGYGDLSPSTLWGRLATVILIYGGGINRDLMTSDGHPLTIVRSPSNHLALADGEVFLVSENHFQRLAVLKDLPDSLWQATIHLLKNYLKIPYPHRRANRIEIHQINSHPAATSPCADQLLKTGFEKDGEKLVLWPSAV